MANRGAMKGSGWTCRAGSNEMEEYVIVGEIGQFNSPT